MRADAIEWKQSAQLKSTKDVTLVMQRVGLMLMPDKKDE